MAADVRTTINESPMSSLQIIAVSVCIFLNMLDGFDALSIAFAASSIAAEWHLSGTQLGFLFSAGLIGMCFGSMLLAPLADYVGRRAIALACLSIISVGMLGSGFVENVVQLAACRFATGLGVGGLIATITVFTSEYSSNKWRSAAITMQSTGYAAGATIGGIIASFLLIRYGWRSVFVFGGAMTVAVIPLVLLTIPESFEFMISKRKAGALARINKLLARMHHAPIDALPIRAPSDETEQLAGFRSLLSKELLLRTVLIWVAFFCVWSSFYFVMSWTPRLLVQAGMSTAQGLTGGVLLNLGGIGGCVLFSLLSSRVELRTLLWAHLIVGGGLLALFGLFITSLTTALCIAVLIGGAVSACIGGMMSLTPVVYPFRSRSTGVGVAMSVGRLGSIVSPFMVGTLLDSGWQVQNLFILFAVPLLVAVLPVVVVFGLIRRPLRAPAPKVARI